MKNRILEGQWNNDFFFLLYFWSLNPGLCASWANIVPMSGTPTLDFLLCILLYLLSLYHLMQHLFRRLNHKGLHPSDLCLAQWLALLLPIWLLHASLTFSWCSMGQSGISLQNQSHLFHAPSLNHMLPPLERCA